MCLTDCGVRFQRDRFKSLYEQRDEKLAKIPYFWSSVVRLILEAGAGALTI